MSTLILTKSAESLDFIGEAKRVAAEIETTAATLREAEKARVCFMPGNLREQATRLQQELDALTQQIEARNKGTVPKS